MKICFYFEKKLQVFVLTKLKQNKSYFTEKAFGSNVEKLSATAFSSTQRELCENLPFCTPLKLSYSSSLSSDSQPRRTRACTWLRFLPEDPSALSFVPSSFISILRNYSRHRKATEKVTRISFNYFILYNLFFLKQYFPEYSTEI